MVQLRLLLGRYPHHAAVMVVTRGCCLSRLLRKYGRTVMSRSPSKSRAHGVVGSEMVRRVEGGGLLLVLVRAYNLALVLLLLMVLYHGSNLHVQSAPLSRFRVLLAGSREGGILGELMVMMVGQCKN